MNTWPSIVEAHAGLVWQTIRRLISHEEDAADCFQETFAAAFAASEQQQVRHWPAFLVRVATINHSIGCGVVVVSHSA